GYFARPRHEEGYADAAFERLAFVPAQRPVDAGVVGEEGLAARTAVVAEEEDQRVLVLSRFAEMGRDTPDRVVQTDEQRQIAAPLAIGDGFRDTVAVFLQQLQRGVDRVVGEVEEPRLVLVALDEGQRFIREQLGGVAIELLHLAVAIDHVFGVSGAELRLGILAQQIIVSADEKAKVIIEATRLRMMRAIEALMPFA